MAAQRQRPFRPPAVNSRMPRWKDAPLRRPRCEARSPEITAPVVDREHRTEMRSPETRQSVFAEGLAALDMSAGTDAFSESKLWMLHTR